MREIHFYSSLYLVPEEVKELNILYSTYDETERAIESLSINVIHTTSMAHLSETLFDYDIDRIWVHDNDGEPFCINVINRLDEFHYNIECDATQRELRQGHNLFKLWRAGEFSVR